MTNNPELPSAAALNRDELLDHWLGHRRLTRRTIECFPEEKLFHFTPAPPMRSFGDLMKEVIGMVEPVLEGFAAGKWTLELTDLSLVDNKAGLLEAFDRSTAMMKGGWPTIPDLRFREVESVYGMPLQANVHVFLYLLDNEVHHRAQGFVYLRLLEIEPPAFYQR